MTTPAWAMTILLDWKIVKDPESGFMIGSCERLGLAAQGGDLKQLHAEADALAIDLLEHLAEHTDILEYLRENRVEVQVQILRPTSPIFSATMSTQPPRPPPLPQPLS